MSEDLAALVLPEEYRATRAHLFPSPQSLGWFLRQHRTALTDAGALTIIAGKTRLHSAKTDEVLVAVGREAARKAVA
jgi:hypothetical protein